MAAASVDAAVGTGKRGKDRSDGAEEREVRAVVRDGTLTQAAECCKVVENTAAGSPQRAQRVDYS